MVAAVSNILTTEGYFERFFWHLQNGCKYHRQAYQAVENERQKIGAPKKYTDYLSFKRGKRYHLTEKCRLN